ncbi:alpha/beta fold hydrolase [Leptospira wolffii]|uniref:Alpha/beta fold hydrolase n=1 Tax=Leptospira wolffii TaxID=409998 RepID=A0ABV5BRP9_9LEPT
MIKKISRFLALLFSGFILLIFLILLSFRIAAHLREKENRTSSAPNSGKFVKGEDVEIFIQEIGPKDGKVVLFVHGMGAWSEIWKDIQHSIASKGYRTISIDLPPFGFSERPDISSFSTRAQGKRILGILHSLGISKAILVGHSFGGGPTLHAALLEPSIVDKLVLVDIAAQIESSDSDPKIPAVIQFALDKDWIRNPILSATGTNPLLTKTLFRSFVHKKEAITDEKATMIRVPMRLENSTEYMGKWMVQFVMKNDPSLSEDLPVNVSGMKMPIHILWGNQDTVTPMSQGENLAKALPGSRLKVLEGLGHIPQLEDPNLFLSALSECLEK